VRRNGVGVAVVAGLMVSGIVVLQSTNAAFSGVTTNSGDSWAAGTVVLSDDDSATAMFASGAIVPGQSAAKCIAVTYSGTLAGVVRMYVTGLTGTLAPDLQLTVEQSTGGGFPDCSAFNSGAATQLFSGTLAAFAAQAYSFATGVGAWSPSGSGQTRVYRLTWTLSSSTANSQQGAVAGCGLVWEAQA
jgi:hypothetical protein